MDGKRSMTKEIEKIILEAKEFEQRRIGQELHDNLCQQLTGASLMMRALAQRLTEKMPQEAVNNAIRHGKAKRVIIALIKGKHHAVLMVRDNGSGFPRDAHGETIVSCAFPYTLSPSLEFAYQGI